MPAITSIAAGVGALASTAGTVAGIKGAKKNRKRQDAQFDRQTELQERGIDVQEERLAWARSVYEGWRQEFDPVLQELKGEAMTLRRPDYEAISADNALAFQSQRDSMERRLRGFGVRADSGAFGENQRRFGIAEALSEVNARQAARRQAANDRFSRLARVYGVGAGLQQTAMSGVDRGYSGITGALQAAAGGAADQGYAYGNLARQNAASAGNSASAAFSNWADFIDQSFNDNTPPPEPAPAGGGGFAGRGG